LGLTVTPPRQSALTGKARWVHVIPSVDDAAMAELLIVTATKIPVLGLNATPHQFALTGKVRCVHAIPSVDEAAIVPP
jgi:hypothetical protein